MKCPTPLALSLGTVCLLFQSAHATLLFSEGFNYTAGSNLGGNVNPGSSVAWTGGNSQLAIGSSALSYPSYPGLTGNDLLYAPTGAGASTTVNTYSAVTSGTLYYSFLIDCTSLPSANNYITSLNPATAAPGGSSDDLAIYVGTPSTGNWKLGVRTTGGGSGANYAGTALSLNTTYFVVAELTLGTSPTVSLFLDPTPGGTQPGTPDATQSTTTAITSVDDVGFKAQGNLTTGDFTIDDLLVGTAWSDVTPGAVPEPSVFALSGLGLLALLRFRRQR